MSNVQIPNLPAVAALSGAELFEGVQAGTSVKISLDQVIAAARIGTPATLPFSVSVGGTGVTTITGYIKGSGTTPFTGSATIPNTDITGLGTMSTQDASAVNITGGSITGITDLAVADGGTGVSTLTGYVKGSGTTPLTASATIPSTDITGLGTMSTQNANSVAITGGSVTGITDLAVADGGTGQGSALTQYGLIYGSTTTAMASTAAGTSTQVLHGNASGAPTFSAVSLTSDVSGTLPVGNGGTGVTTSTGSGAVVLGTGPTITAAALNGTVGATTPSTGAFTTVTASTSVLSPGTGGIGYATGAGVSVTQGTSRTTSPPTTGASPTGAITLFTAAPVVGTYFSFTVPNTGIAVTDTVVLTVRGGTNTYIANCTSITAATSFRVTMVSVSGVASDTPIVNFTIIKGVSA
jgi:hypothetical protein